jgi:hypothetical protein
LFNALDSEYAGRLPLTLRQIFCRLVGVYAYEKSKQAHKRLTELMNKARRAEVVEMSAIRDDGFTSEQPVFFESVDDFLDNVVSQADQLPLDRQRGQERRLVVWCEAAGMGPQLARIARPFGIEVCSSGGFDSLTDEHRSRQLWADWAVTVLHIGDHDPSGVHVFSSLAEDIEEFAAAYGGDVEFDLDEMPGAFRPKLNGAGKTDQAAKRRRRDREGAPSDGAPGGGCYRMTWRGLWWFEDETLVEIMESAGYHRPAKGAMWLAPEFQVEAMVHDGAGNGSGLLLRWRDHRKRKHQWVMPARALGGSHEEIWGALLDGGLRITPERVGRNKLAAYLSSVIVDKEARVVSRMG